VGRLSRYQTNWSITCATSPPGTGPTRTSQAPSIVCDSRPRIWGVGEEPRDDRRAAIAGGAAPADVDAKQVALDGPDGEAVGTGRSELGGHTRGIGSGLVMLSYPGSTFIELKSCHPSRGRTKG
jgi:hypothetical protein